MARKYWHLTRTSSFFGATYTAWCGFTARKKDVERKGFFGTGPTCPACKRAKRAGKGKR